MDMCYGHYLKNPYSELPLILFNSYFLHEAFHSHHFKLGLLFYSLPLHPIHFFRTCYIILCLFVHLYNSYLDYQFFLAGTLILLVYCSISSIYDSTQHMRGILSFMLET